MEPQGVFGIMGTYGERDNKALFSRGMRTLAAATKTFELLALELHIADLRDQLEKGFPSRERCTIEELNKAREAAKRLMEPIIEDGKEDGK